MRPAVPPYFDHLIRAYRSGRAGRNVHLGYWDVPPPLHAPCAPQEFEAAQARLNDVVLALADLAPGQAVLDVACGLGGTLETVARGRDLRLVGVNIDPRQLAICRGIAAAGNALSFVQADACALPFRAESFDRVLCVEAMFHFRAREAFLRQAAAVLRPGGRLVVSDILLRAPGAGAPLPRTAIEAVIRRDFGPWPDPWEDLDGITAAAARAGLVRERMLDATRHTLPSHRVTAPQPHEGIPDSPSAGHVLRWLHVSGHMSYVCLAFVKR